LVLHVTVELPLGGDGRASLQLPAHWAGETLHSLSNLRALSEAKLEVDPKGDAAELYGPPNGVATIAYDLEKDWTVRSFIRCSSIRSDVRQHGIEPRTRERSGHHVAKRHYAHHLN
jgi:hypothetical protein